MSKYLATPEVLGYKSGSVLLGLTEGTTDGLENVKIVQGQPYSLLRAWQAATLSYVTLGLDASGNLLVSGGASTGSAGSTTVDANLTSAGSTRLVGQFTVNNPTTAVTITNPTTTVTISNPTTAVTVSNPTTAVDLTSAGSTRLAGQFTVANPTTSVTITNPTTTVTVSNPTTAVDLSSAGSTRVVGTVNVTSGSVLGPSTAAIGVVSITTSTAQIGSVSLLAGSSANVVGSVVLGAGSSANTIGNVAQGPGSSATAPWFVDGLAFSSAQTSASTVATSAEGALLAANASRRGAVITNLSTAVELLIGFTTATVSTARANCHYIIPANGKITIGGQLGDVPLYTGPIRGRLNSTTLAGVAGIIQFTS